jgi:hypothetical protein
VLCVGEVLGVVLQVLVVVLQVFGWGYETAGLVQVNVCWGEGVSSIHK